MKRKSFVSLGMEAAIGILVCVTMAAIPSSLLGQDEASGLHARHMEVLAESGGMEAVAGGTLLHVHGPDPAVFSAAVNWLQSSGYTVVSAIRDAGEIRTGITIRGHWSQTGTHVELSLIDSSQSETDVRVAVVEQHRHKMLQTEPWGSPKLDAKASQALANQIQPVLEAAAARARTSAPAPRNQPAVASAPPAVVHMGDSEAQVIRALGQPRSRIDLGAKQLLIYSEVKVTLRDGKVSDVE